MTAYQWLGVVLVVVPVLWFLIYTALDDWELFKGLMGLLGFVASAGVGFAFLNGWLP